MPGKHTVHRDAQSFHLALLREAVDIPDEIETKVLRLIALEIFAAIIRRSPVDRGFYRASHNVSVNSIDLSVPTAPVKPDKGTALAQLRTLKPGDTIYISTNLPYSEVIENGGYSEGPKTVGGFSRQAPGGVYRVSIASVLAKLKAGG